MTTGISAGVDVYSRVDADSYEYDVLRHEISDFSRCRNE